MAELRAFLNSECQKTNNELAQFREKFKMSANLSDDAYKALVDDFLEKTEGATNVEYNDNGEPVHIKMRGKNASWLEEKIKSSHVFRRNHVQEYLAQPKPGLDGIS